MCQPCHCPPGPLPGGPVLAGVGARGCPGAVQLRPVARPLATWAHCLPRSFPCTGFIFLFCLLRCYQKGNFWFKCSLNKFEAQSCLAAPGPAGSVSNSCSAGRRGQEQRPAGSGSDSCSDTDSRGNGNFLLLLYNLLSPAPSLA